MKPKTIAIDLDGVLAHYTKWGGVETIGNAVVGSHDIVDQLIDAGHSVFVFTTRTNEYINKGHTIQELRTIIAKWLKQEKFNDQLFIYDLPGKPIADLYIDDHAYKHNPNATWFQDEIETVVKRLEESE